MHILYISQYFPPEMGAPSARVYELSRNWIEAGEKVSVLTAFPNHPTGIIFPGYRQHFYKREEMAGIEIFRTYIFPAPNKGFAKRVLNYISFMFSSLFTGLFVGGKVDVIIATSPQFFVAVAGYILSRIKSKPFILEIRDLWPQSIVELGQINNKFVIGLLRKIELHLYKHANKIVVVVDSFVDYLTRLNIPKEKIHIVRNGVDLTHFNPKIDGNKIKQKLGLKAKFIVSYIGTHGLSHALDKVLEAALLLKKNDDIHFILIGEGAEKDKLIAQANRLDLDNVSFLDQIKKENLPDYYSLSDVVLVTLRKIPLFMNALPSKMFEIMAMKRPIVLSVDGEARELIADKAQAALFAEPENPQSLCNAILELKSDINLRNALSENGRKFVELYFDRKQLSADFLKILKSSYRGV